MLNFINHCDKMKIVDKIYEEVNYEIRNFS